MRDPVLIGFDIESTGTDSAVDVPVQICLVMQQGANQRILLNTLVNPGRPIPKEASDIHRITDAQVVSGPDIAMASWVTSVLCEHLKPDYIVGFNSISYDEPILTRCLGSPVFEGVPHIDVLDVAFRYFPELPSHKLGQLYQHFMGYPLAGAHDASSDVIGTLNVLEAMRLKIGLPMKNLAEQMAVPQPYAIMPIGKFKGQPRSVVDLSWARYMKRESQKGNMRPDLLATVDAILAGK